MQIAIMSDSHDNIPNLEKALKYINEQGIKVIIHCGDLCAPVILTKVMMPNFSGQIHLVHGNVGDPDLLEEVAKKYQPSHETLRPPGLVKVHGDRGEVEIEGKKIAFCHLPEEARQLAQTGEFDIVFYGHTHRPWLTEAQTNTDLTQTDTEKTVRLSQPITRPKSAILVNPGTLAGMFYKATFAIYDTTSDKLELKILEQM